MKRSLPAPMGDVALLIARVLLGVIMIAHGYQKLVVNGIGRTTAGFESMSIPVAIVSASFVTVVELVGGVLLVLGLMTRTVGGVHGGRDGRGGGLRAPAPRRVRRLRRVGAGRLDRGSAAGAGRGGPGAVQPRAPSPGAAAAAGGGRRPRGTRAGRAGRTEQEVIPPAGLPVTPLIRLTPDGPRPAGPPRFPQPVASGPAGPPPVRRPGPPPAPMRYL